MLKIALFLFSFFLLVGVCYSQPNLKIAKLRKEMNHARSIKSKGFISLELAKLFHDVNTDSVCFYADLAIKWGRESKNNSILASGYHHKGVGYSKMGRLDEAIELFYQGLRLREKLGEHAKVSSSNLSIGNLYFDQGVLEEENGRYTKADTNYIKSLNFYKSGLRFAKMSGDSIQISKSYQNIGGAYFRLYEYEDAIKNFDMSYNTYPVSNRDWVYAELKTNILACEIELDRAENLESTYNVILDCAKRNNQLEQWVNLNITYAGGLWKSSPDRAMSLLESADSMAIVSKNVLCRIQANQSMYLLNKELGRSEKALEHYEIYSQLAAEISDTKTRTKIEELNIRYGTEKKERLLAEKNAAITTAESEKVIFIWSLIGLGIFLIALTAFFFQRQYIQRLRRKREQAAHNEEVSSLLANQELKSIEAMLEGQETERKRIAEDLHDRLGSTLAAAKMYYESTFYDSEIDSKQTKTYELIDKAIKDTREISHNLVSGALSRFGLFVALKDLKETIEGASKVRVNLTIDARDERFHSEVEIQIYRIVQEVFSNALKHSNATELFTQLTQQKHEIHLTVSDNGKGFNPEKVERGMGLNNIRGRVSKLGGTCELKSTKETGTTYSITFNLNHID